MRRSEAVGRLVGYLIDQEMMAGIKMNVNKISLANYMLDCVERMGMLPPPKSLDNINESILYYYTTDGVHYSGKLEDVGTVTDVSILWEPEKEEDET